MSAPKVSAVIQQLHASQRSPRHVFRQATRCVYVRLSPDDSQANYLQAEMATNGMCYVSIKDQQGRVVRVLFDGDIASERRADVEEHPECSICRRRHGKEIIHACE